MHFFGKALDNELGKTLICHGVRLKAQGAENKNICFFSPFHLVPLALSLRQARAPLPMNT
jgi:hypothetical protein